MTHTSKQVNWWCSGSSELGLPSRVTKCVYSRDRRPTVQHEGGEALVSFKAAYTLREGQMERGSGDHTTGNTLPHRNKHWHMDMRSVCLPTLTMYTWQHSMHYTLNSNTHQTNLSLPKLIIICSLTDKTNCRN